MESHCYAPMSGTRRSSLSLSLSRSFFLSLFRLPHREAASETEGTVEGEDRRREGKIRGETGTLYNYFSFYVREPARPVSFSFSSFRVHSLIFSPFLLLFPFRPLLALSSTARSLARAVSLFSFSLLFFFLLALGPLLLMVGASDASAYERARVTNANTNGRTDGHARMHTGKPKRSARE